MREQHGVRDADIARADHRDSFCRAGLRRGEIGHYRSCRCWGQPPLAATGGPLNSSCRSSPAEGRIRTEILRRGSCEILPFGALGIRSEEHTSELQSLMRISYAVFCLQNKKKRQTKNKKQ